MKNRVYPFDQDSDKIEEFTAVAIPFFSGSPKELKARAERAADNLPSFERTDQPTVLSSEFVARVLRNHRKIVKNASEADNSKKSKKKV
jgi:hypothetical protein